MTTETDGYLDEAERTPDWDMFRLRTLLTIVERAQLYFSAEQFERWRKQCDRMQNLIREKYGKVMGS